MFQEDKIISFWTWTSVLSVFISLTCLFIRMMFGRIISPNRGLQGARVLITNGSSELSQSLQKQLQDKYLCKVMLVDTHKLSHDLLDPTECRIKLDDLLKNFGPVDIVIHNDHDDAKEDFLTREDRNIREFLNIFMVMIPKMHLTGGGQIVSVKSSSSSTHGLIETRKDYCELAQNLIKDVPAAPSNFILTIVQNLLPPSIDRVSRADRVIEAIASQKPVIRLTDQLSSLDKITELTRRGLNNLGFSL